MSIRVCNVPRCPELTDHRSGKCEAHRSEARRAADSRRPGTVQRGYGRGHRKTREELARRVAAGGVNCARCGDPILSGEPWDLDHDDTDRLRYIGASHERCNRATKTHAIAASRTPG